VGPKKKIPMESIMMIRTLQSPVVVVLVMKTTQQLENPQTNPVPKKRRRLLKRKRTSLKNLRRPQNPQKTNLMGLLKRRATNLMKPKKREIPGRKVYPQRKMVKLQQRMLRTLMKVRYALKILL